MANYNSLYTGAQIDSAIGALNTALQPSDIANFETSTELNTRDSDNRNRANHTGTQLASTISDFNSSVTSVVNGLGLGAIDSAQVTNIVDSDYVQARQDYSYSSLTGLPTFLDSALVSQLIDSDYVQLRQAGINILDIFDTVDSAYVQERQDFAYASLTGAPNVLDSGDITTLIDSAYVQARQLGVEATGIDSAQVIQLIDSDYIELRRPAEAIFNVVNNSAVSYLFTGDGFPTVSENNPSIKLTKGLTYKFNVNASGHPFQIRVSDGGAAYNDGVTNNGAEVGTILFTVPMDAPDTLYYQCTVHSGMGASIVLNDLSGSTTDTVPEGSTNLYYTSARVDSDVLALIDSAYVQTRQDFAYSSLTGTPSFLDSALVTQLIDSAYVQLRQSDVGSAGLDSALTEQFIDSAYVQARQDFAYSSLTGTPTALSAFTNDTLYLDSATATQLIDSAYIQLRQSSVGTGGLDSALVTQLIDSAYVQLRETPQDFAYSSLTGAPNVLDSADIALIAGSISGLDSTGVRTLVDSAYVQARQDYAYSSLTGTPTALSAFINDTLYLDSATATQLIDSAYIQLRQSNVGTGGVDSAYVTAQINALIDGAPGALDTLNELAAAINDDSQAYNTLLSLVNTKIDSAIALTLITTTVDSAYVQLRQSTVGTGGLDSALTIQLIDSAYVQARQDFAYSSLTGTPNVLDSADVSAIAGGLSGLDSTGVINLVDSAYVQLRQSLSSANTFTAIASGALADGSPVVVNADGTVSVVAKEGPPTLGTPTTFESATVTNGNIAAAYDPSNQRVLIAYSDGGNSNYGTAVVGVVSGTSITFGTPQVFSSASTSVSQVFYSSANSNFVIVYDAANNGAVAATVSDTTITFGTPATFTGSIIINSASVRDGSSFVVNYVESNSMKLIVGTVSGNTISFGTGSTWSFSLTYDGNLAWAESVQRYIMVYRSFSSPKKGVFRVVTSAGSVSSEAQWLNSDPGGTNATFDSASNRFLVLYGGTGTNAVVATPATTTASTVFGTPVQIDTGNFSAADDATTVSVIGAGNNKIAAAWRDTTPTIDPGKLAFFTIDNTDNSVSASAIANWGDSTVSVNSLIGMAYDTVNSKVVLAYSDNGDNDYGKGVVVSLPAVEDNLTKDNFLGFSNAAYSDGDSATIQTIGAVDDAQTGLTPGATYYIQSNGSLTDSEGASSIVAGLALSSTEINVKVGRPNILDSADVLLIASSAGGGLDSAAVTGLVDSAYVALRTPAVTGFLDSAAVITLVDSAYVALRAPAAAGGVDSAAANTLIDAKIQVLDIADIVGATGNPGEYLKSLGNGNASWENVTTVIDSAYVAARAPAASGFLDSAAAITLVDSAYVLARSPAGPATWQKISANYTLSAGDRIAVSTDSAWTMTLPASPTFSDEVYIIDATGNAAVKNITVSGNSQKILASDSDLLINVNRASVAMMFYGDSQGWILTSAF